MTLAALLVSAAHTALLGAWLGEAAHPAVTPQRLAAVAMDVRQIRSAATTGDAAAPAAQLTPQALPSVLASETDRAQARGTRDERRTTAGALPPLLAPGAQAAPVAEPAKRTAPAKTSEPADPFGPASASEDTATAAAPPTYRTQLPPSMTLHYDVRRGDVLGQARLDWQVRADGHYEIELRAVGNDAGGRPMPAALTPHWTSRGMLDAAGIAPERFAVSRRGRERHAANFQREPGFVTFAGPARTWPLVEGAQDRLSWMLQLAAVLQAEPLLATAGASVSMMVVGAHGDAGVWTFVVLGSEVAQDAQGKPIAAVALQRESRHAHDPQVQVWLAPDRHHLPVRLRLTLPRTGESTEFRLRALQPEPR